MNLVKNTILLVDDTPANLKILVKFLDGEGYDLKIALNGSRAIEIAKESPPDLILLDVMMEGLNGYETCKKIKEDQNLKNIPIIFLTALSSVSSQVEAFEAGGVDFISKPLRNEEVLIRIKNHLLIRNQQKLLEEKNNQLKSLIMDREKLISIIAHDLRAPIASLFSYTNLITLKLKDKDNLLYEMGNKLEENSKRTLNLIENLLNWSNTQKDIFLNKPEILNLYKDIKNTIEVLEFQAANKEVKIYNEVSENLTAFYDKNMFQTILRNLISNSIKFSNKEGSIWIKANFLGDNFIEIIIKDNGVGIEKKNLSKLFNLENNYHTKGTKNEKGSGFGLIFCKDMIEKMGGKIWVESETNKGTTFHLTLIKE